MDSNQGIGDGVLTDEATPADNPLLRLATVREACAYGKMSKSKLYDYLAQGKITAYRRGGKTLVDLRSIDDMPLELWVPWRKRGKK